jgi:hypothetical protein
LWNGHSGARTHDLGVSIHVTAYKHHALTNYAI